MSEETYGKWVEEVRCAGHNAGFEAAQSVAGAGRIHDTFLAWSQRENSYPEPEEAELFDRAYR